MGHGKKANSYLRYQREYRNEEHIQQRGVDGSAGITLRAILPEATQNMAVLRLRGKPRFLKCPLCGNVSNHGKARDAETGLCLSAKACERRQADLYPDELQES